MLINKVWNLPMNDNENMNHNSTCPRRKLHSLYIGGVTLYLAFDLEPK